MHWIRLAILALAGVGATLAAQQAVDDARPVVIAQADEEAGSDADGESVSMSEAELEAELERIEEAVEETDELKEFKPSKPLAADLSVALPSDI